MTQTKRRPDCEYSKPNANPPIFCKKISTHTLDFGIGITHLCEEHWEHFWLNIVPYLSNDEEELEDIDLEPEYFETA